MKRHNNLYQKIYDIDNLTLADLTARKGKSDQYGVKAHNANPDINIRMLHETLKNNEYKTSKYTSFMVYEPKEREVFRLPYFPDRIVQHAIVNIIDPIFTPTFTADTYSCIKERGVHSMGEKIKIALKDEINTAYVLKIDITKFYPSVDHEILKQLIRRKIKDQDLLYLLDEIIGSADGLPIGNYVSQLFSNIYLNGFDHWIKEEKRVKYYFRYADDIIIFMNNKPDLHRLLSEIKIYLKDNLKLIVKPNYQVFPVKKRGIDIIGYVFWHTHTRIRPSIKKRCARMLARRRNSKSIASYRGWIKHCDGRHLEKKLFGKEIQRTGH